MSGNQETRMIPSSWQCSDFNAGIPIKKRKFFVRPISPPTKEASLTPAENSQPNEQGGGNASSVSCSVDVNENTEKTFPAEKRGSRVTGSVADQKIIDWPSSNIEQPLSLFQSDLMGNVGQIEKPGKVKSADTVSSSVEVEMKLAHTENPVLGLVDRRKVKTEELDFPVCSVSFAGIEKKEQLVKPFGSNIVSSSVKTFPLAKFANKEKLVEAESSGVVISSEETGMKIDRSELTMHGMIEENCDNENVQGECQTELSSAELPLDCKTGNTIQYRENDGSLALNLSLSKGCRPHNTDETSVSTNAGVYNGINRSNWDLNITMDAWGNAQECTSVGKAKGGLLSNKSCPHDIKASSSFGKTVVANSVSEVKAKESVGFRSDVVTSVQSAHQDNSGCSLSLGLSSYPPNENSTSSASTTQTGSDYTSFSKPMMSAGDVNPVSLRIVKSEHLDEFVRTSNKVKQELAEKCSQEAISSPGFLKSVDPTSVKAEPNSSIQSEAVNRKDGSSSHPDIPIIQPNEMRDLPTCSTSNQKEKQMPYPTGYRRISMSLTGITVNPDDLKYSECTLHENSAQSSSEAHGEICKTLKHAETNISTCFDQGDNNHNVSGMTVASLTGDKTVDDRKNCRSKELPLNSRGTDESSLSDEEKINLSGDMLEQDSYGSDFESDGAHDLSKAKKKQDGRINEDGKVQRSTAAVVSEDNSTSKKSKLAPTNCDGSKTKSENIAVFCHGDFQNSSHVGESGSEFSIYGKTVEMPSSEVEIERLIPELQRRALDGSGEKEGPIIRDGEHSSCRVIHASEGVSAKTLDASSSFGPSRVERERLHDLPLESRKFLSRGRDDVYNDESYKFSRERYNGHFRNQRLNFMPDRRRFPDRTENNPRDRDSENFEFNNYGNAREDGAFVRSFRRGRRHWNDETTFFPHSFSRRQSPGYSFTHRGPRNSENPSAFHGLRDGENFTRGLPRNNMDPMARPQRSYEDLDGRFVRGQRNFSTNHKRGFPQFHSRSPTRSRARSPGPCSSFRNRSPDGYVGHPDVPRRRSSPSYRMERMRSPDNSGFPRDARRHASPPYSSRPSNVLRDVGSGRGRGYRRSGISFRNQPDHVFRNHGKFNILDSRERVEYGDDFFEGPSHSDRFGEFGVDLNVEKRRFSDRHDGVRSFGQSFNTDGCAPSNIENDRDSMRFGQEDVTETEEQGNVREFDGQNKNFSDNAFGRARNVEEKEESSRHGGEIWQDDEFDGEQVRKKVY